MFNIFIIWKFRISKTQLRCDYKQNEVVYNGLVLPLTYKDDNFEPTGNFPALVI